MLTHAILSPSIMLKRCGEKAGTGQKTSLPTRTRRTQTPVVPVGGIGLEQARFVLAHQRVNNGDHLTKVKTRL